MNRKGSHYVAKASDCPAPVPAPAVFPGNDQASRPGTMFTCIVAALIGLLIVTSTATGQDISTARPSAAGQVLPLVESAAAVDPRAAGTFLVPVADTAISAVNRQERAALAAFYKATGGQNWYDDSNWLSDEPLNRWRGVSTGPDGRVEFLNLYGNGLTGRIPQEITQLGSLRTLGLSENLLTGRIPMGVGKLSNLRTLALDGNLLTGRVPPEINRLEQLEFLDLSGNSISGPLPPELAALKQLRVLRLARNRFGGELPSFLGKLTSLEVLDLHSNDFRGPLPVEIGQLASLSELNLASNRMTGPIPPELGALRLLELLDLSGNQLSDFIPSALSQLNQLRELDLSRNRLSGPVPSLLATLSRLQRLEISANELAGQIPPALAGHSKMRTLRLQGNRLTGPIPPEFGKAADLVTLSLASNQLSGAMPAALGRASKLKTLHLSNNQLAGPIDPALHRLIGLGSLFLGPGHRFEGCLPPHWFEVPDTDIGRIRLPACPFGLPGLDVSPGLLAPEFAGHRKEYALRVGNGVEVITLDPILVDQTAKFLDPEGRLLPDADPGSQGHQIRFDGSEIGVRIQVESTDGSQQAIYELTVRGLFPHAIKVLSSQHFSAPGNERLRHNVPDLEVQAEGQTLVADFLSHFNATGGIDRWGYPTSEVLVLEPGTLTQFYQRGVVDFRNNGQEWLMQRRLAWDYLGGGLGGSSDLGVEPDIVNPHPGRISGPWGHKVSDLAIDGVATGFADFYSRLGGLAAFGYPKTDARLDTGATGTLHHESLAPGFVRQYFQAAVFEYHPGDAGDPIKLALLGDALRNLLVPGHGEEAAFAPASQLVPNAAYTAYSVPASAGVAQPASLPQSTSLQPDTSEHPSVYASVQLFEGGIETFSLPYLQRIYADRFNAVTTREVWADVILELPPGDAFGGENFVIRFFGPNDRVLRSVSYSIPGQRRVQSWSYVVGAGRRTPGFWRPGNYRIELSIGDTVIGGREFVMLPGRLPGTVEFDSLRQSLSWGPPPNSRLQLEGLLALASIHGQDPATAAEIASWAWVGADPNPLDLRVLQSLAALARTDLELVRTLAASQWLQGELSDGDREFMVAAATLRPGFARLVTGRPSADEQPAEWQVRAVQDLQQIDLEAPELTDRLESQPWFSDGVSEAESAILAFLHSVSQSRHLSGALLERPRLQFRKIATDLSSVINLTIVSRQSVSAQFDLVEFVELGVRAIENHLGIPWPSQDVIIFLEPRIGEVGIRGPGVYWNNRVLVTFTGGRRGLLTNIFNGLGHYYFSGAVAPKWLSESAAVYIHNFGLWQAGELTEQAWTEAAPLEFRINCHAHQIYTVTDLQTDAEVLRAGIYRSRLSNCLYWLGQNFLVQIRQLLGSNAVGEALGQIAQISRKEDRPATDGEVLAAFMAAAPAEKIEALTALYDELYGVPVAGGSGQ